MDARNVRRGEIFWGEVPKEHTVGSEQWKRRPWIVVSDPRTLRRGLVVAVPTSTTESSVSLFSFTLDPGQIRFAPSDDRLVAGTTVLTDQIRVMATQRLGRRAGTLVPEALAMLEDNLLKLLSIHRTA